MSLPAPVPTLHPLIAKAKHDAEQAYKLLIERGFLPADAELKIRMMLDSRMASQVAKGVKS